MYFQWGFRHQIHTILTPEVTLHFQKTLFLKFLTAYYNNTIIDQGKELLETFAAFLL